MIPPVNRRETAIVDMLERFEEARCQAQSEGGTGGEFDSSALVFDEATFTREFRELDRALTLMRATMPSLYFHVSQRYLLCQLRRREIHTHKTRAGHRVPKHLPPWQEVVARPVLMHGETASMTIRVWDKRVDPAKVQEGVAWLSREFRGAPHMPKEMAAA